MGLFIHFYIIFGTNILAGGPVQIVVFFAYFNVSQKRNIKRSPNGMKPSGELLLERKQSRRLGVDVKKQLRRPRGCKAGWEHPAPSWAPCGSPDRLISPIYISIYPKNIEYQDRSGVPPPQAFVATENQSKPVPAPCRRGNPSLVAIFIIPALSMTRRE